MLHQIFIKPDGQILLLHSIEQYPDSVCYEETTTYVPHTQAYLSILPSEFDHPFISQLPLHQEFQGCANSLQLHRLLRKGLASLPYRSWSVRPHKDHQIWQVYDLQLPRARQHERSHLRQAMQPLYPHFDQPTFLRRCCLPCLRHFVLPRPQGGETRLRLVLREVYPVVLHLGPWQGPCLPQGQVLHQSWLHLRLSWDPSQQNSSGPR
jgi:hypothetical protein